MRFIKMHGIGNDYVYINGFESRGMPIDDPSQWAKKVSDRHYGIGADGLILVIPPDKDAKADVCMRMFNADGSEAEMCGNGIRCVCKLAHDYGITTANPMHVQTGSGTLSLAYTLDAEGKVEQVTVDMGSPILEPGDVPVDTGQLAATDQAQTFVIPCVTGEKDWQATFVSMGNPHAVIYVDDLSKIDLHSVGAKLERHQAFPKRMNVHFVQIHGRDEVTMVHWERGSGPTLACGTGASAVCVAGVLTGRTDRRLVGHLPGGDLTLEYREQGGHVFMTGPAVEVFSGDWPG